MPRTQKVFHVLLALRDGPLHGYAIRKRVLEVTDGAVELEPGGLYRLIARLESDRLIDRSDPPEDATSADPRRQYYALTPAGRAVLAEEATRIARLVARPEFRAALSDS